MGFKIKKYFEKQPLPHSQTLNNLKIFMVLKFHHIPNYCIGNEASALRGE
jgi:hypothetical protein